MSRTNFLGKKYLYEVLPMLTWFAEHVPGGFFIYSAKPPFTVLYVNTEVLNIYGCENLDEFKELTGYTFRGISAGANIFKAIELADKNPDKIVVTVLPDTGERYLSVL